MGTLLNSVLSGEEIKENEILLDILFGMASGTVNLNHHIPNNALSSFVEGAAKVPLKELLKED